MNQRNRLYSSASAVMAAVAGLSLSGCQVGPDYKRPEVSAPPKFASEAEPTKTSSIAPAAPIDSTWWSTLNDPTLISLVDRAIAANHDLRRATERIVEARAARGIAAAAGLPNVNVGADYTRARESENTIGGNFGSNDSAGYDRYATGVDAGWEIDVFGGIARSVQAAEGDIQALEENRRDVLVMLAAEVARNYVDVRGFQQRILATLRNIQTQADTLGLTDSRFKAGLTSELDVAQAKAQLETTRATLPPLEESMRAAMHRLGVLVGREPGSTLEELSAAGPIPSAPAQVPVGLPSELVSRRADIRRAERELAAQTARIGVATSDLFPKFSLTGSFGLASAQIGTLADGDSRFWSIGPAVRWPIFQGGAIKANIRVQESRARQALIGYEQVVLVAFEDVENSLVSFSRAQSRRSYLTEAVAANQRAVELSNQLYRAGLADFQRVLTSQLALSVSEEQMVASDQAVVQALIRLYKSLGGGWNALDPTVPESPATVAEPASPGNGPAAPDAK